MSELSFDAPVWRHGKALRKGYTTGSCATAAAKVAALMVLRQHLIHQVSIVTPSGVTLCLNVESPHIEGQQAIAAIRKDGGDDVDATHGMLIFARVTLNDSGEITLTGGEGIGTVTRKGVGLPLGSAAINRTPRHTIESAVREAIGPARGADVEIFAPEGEVRAQKTYNSRLGILGGISIIGTTGIVTPMSEESWKRSLSLELEIKRASGLTRVILVPGNHGERFVREQMGVDTQAVVTMSNFVGYMIEEAVRALALSKLELHRASHLIDVGAGTGSVSIEAALQFPSLQVTAIERNPAALRLLDENRQRFACGNIDILPGEAPMTITGKADAVFMGGSGGHLTALIDWAMGHLHPGGRLVMTFILQENLHSALAHLAHIGACRMDCVQLQLSSLTPLGAGHYFKPNNPVFVIACQKEENHVRDI
ncbi:decarboxylating cobalt-precorrin-6B (C(15))-methyltransferase [Salmonella enterica subsp. enterica serovar Paratyphi A]|nr:decarboxylating cobalt-precorrin-6B (C(15))-methyltransferase [Salmonella enterica subsp. enterica serovar Paratyphi A]